jgi:hypothetical protein
LELILNFFNKNKLKTPAPKVDMNKDAGWID